MNLTPKDVDRFWAKVHIVNDGVSCWEWIAGLDTKGYGVYSLGSGTHRNKRAHRISYTISYGTLTDNLLVLHSCDNPRCVRPGHLYAGTYSDNIADAYRRKRRTPNTGYKSGSRTHPWKGGSLELAREIRTRYATGQFTYEQLGLTYNYTGAMIRYIVKGVSWPEPEETAAL